MLWEPGGAVTVSISQTGGRDGWGCERQARSSAWVHLNAGSTREERTPSPPQLQNQAPWAFYSHLLALALLPLSLSRPPPSLYMSSWLRHKDSVSRFQMILKPPHALFCSFSHSPETSVVAKIKIREGWREERKMGERGRLKRGEVEWESVWEREGEPRKTVRSSSPTLQGLGRLWSLQTSRRRGTGVKIFCIVTLKYKVHKKFWKKSILL